MSPFEELRTKVLALLPRVADLLADADDATRESLAEAQERVRTGRFYVAVCGEFKRGKSSLLNALLAEPGLCPVDVDLATCLASTIGYGAEERIEVVLTKGDAMETVPIARDEIPDYVTEAGNTGNRKRAQMLHVALPNPHLQSGLVLVDTPGVGSVNPAHTAVTYGFLPRADAVIFVCDATEPVNTTELEFLTEIGRQTPHLIVAVTKIDMVGDPSVVVADVRAKVAKASGTDPAQLTVVPVSARRKLDGLFEDDPELVIESNFGELERVVWDGIGRQAGALSLQRACAAMGRALELAVMPVQTEMSTLSADTEGERQRLAQDLRELQRQGAQLSSDRSVWNEVLTERMGDIGQQAEAQMSEEHARITARFNAEYLEDDGFIAKPEELVARLTRDLALAYSAAIDFVGARVTDLYDELLEMTSLELSRPELTGEFEPSQDLEFSFADSRVTSGQRNMRLLKATSTGVALGHLVAGWFGVFGLVAAAAYSLLDATKNEEEQDRTRRQAQVRSQATPWLSTSAQRGRSELQKACRDLTRTLQKDLRARVDAEVRSVNEALAGVNRAAKMTEAEATGRLQVLRRRRNTLVDANTEVHRVMDLVKVLAESDRLQPPASPRPAAPGWPAPGGHDVEVAR